MVLTRNSTRPADGPLAKWGEKVELRTVDYTSKASLVKAFEGVETVISGTLIRSTLDLLLAYVPFSYLWEFNPHSSVAEVDD